jgi:phosphoenolpyruvate-protein phosphotransferase (PTS system enzyme I)
VVRRLPAIPAAPGRARGPAWVHDARRGATPVAPDGLTVEAAAAIAARALDALAQGLRAAGSPDEAEILEAQAVVAADPSLLDAAARRVAAGEDPSAAVRAAADAIAGRLAASPDPVTAARAVDIADVGDRIARVLEGDPLVGPDRPSIVVARELPPSVVVEIPAGMLLGIALEEGSPTAHVALLARALGVPAVVGATGIVGAVSSDGPTNLEVDGTDGWVALGVDDVRPAAVIRATRPEAGARAAAAPGATADGHPVALLANLGLAREVDAALAAGAEGVGLFRTEALFLGRASMPSEASQRTAYRRVFAAMAGRPVVVRIADLGGDRAVPYVGWPREANPALGLRGLRLARWDASLHLAQLRSIGRAAADAAAVPRILAPMVATYDDARFFRELVSDAWGGLRAASGTRPERVLLGAMVEIPAAALIADHLAGEVDFLSIGTNDLAQYALAADRGVAALAALQDALDPAVLRLVRMAVEAGKAAGIPVGACGALAGDPDGALVLAGLGVDSLSAEPAALGGLRAALAAARIGDLRGLADEALRARTATEVRALVAEARGLV